MCSQIPSSWPNAQKVHTQEASKEYFDELKRKYKSNTLGMKAEQPSILPPPILLCMALNEWS